MSVPVSYRTHRGPPRHDAFFFNATATTEIYTLSLHDALPILRRSKCRSALLRQSKAFARRTLSPPTNRRSEEHTSELQSRPHLVCRLLLEKKKQHRIRARRTCREAHPTTTLPKHAPAHAPAPP